MPTSPRQTTIGARPRRPTTARQPVLGLPASLLMHGLAIASIFLVFNSAYRPPEESHAVPVDLVTLASVTNVAPAAPPAPPPPPDEPVKRDLEPLPPPPEPKMVEAEPAPDIKPPQFEIEKPKIPDTRQDISKLLTQLTAPEKPERTRDSQTSRAGPATAMTATLIDAFLSQIRRCWSPIPGAPNPADQIVSFDLRLNPDGTVASLRLLEASATPYGSAAAQAASRAIYQCQPYRLPAERYNQWREINPLRFDPRRMMQQ